LFKDLIPYLILLASGLLAVQDPLRAWLTRRMGEDHGSRLEKLTWLPVVWLRSMEAISARG